MSFAAVAPIVATVAPIAFAFAVAFAIGVPTAFAVVPTTFAVVAPIAVGIPIAVGKARVAVPLHREIG